MNTGLMLLFATLLFDLFLVSKMLLLFVLLFATLCYSYLLDRLIIICIKYSNIFALNLLTLMVNYSLMAELIKLKTIMPKTLNLGFKQFKKSCKNCQAFDFYKQKNPSKKGLNLYLGFLGELEYLKKYFKT